MRTSVIIPVHGKAALTNQCLESLRSEVGGRSDVEVIVVDDASPDGTRAAVEAAQWVRLVGHDRPAGFAASCNEAASVAQGEYLVLLNNDTVGQGGWLDRLVTYADEHPEAGVAGAKLLYANNTIQHAGI